MTVEEDIVELKNRISDTYSIPIEFMKYFGLSSTLTLTLEDGYDRCIKCRKMFPSNELTDVHYATTLGVKLYKHTPRPMCKKCLNEAFEDIANKYGWNLSGHSYDECDGKIRGISCEECLNDNCSVKKQNGDNQ